VRRLGHPLNHVDHGDDICSLGHGAHAPGCLCVAADGVAPFATPRRRFVVVSSLADGAGVGDRAVCGLISVLRYGGKVQPNGAGPTHAVGKPSGLHGNSQTMQAACGPQKGTQSASLLQSKHLPEA
jgi:hypothetical protein